MLLGTTRPRQDLKGSKPLSTRTLSVAVVWFIFPVAVALGQQTPPYISHPRRHAIPGGLPPGLLRQVTYPSRYSIVLDGADNDLESALRQFTPRESIYLYSRSNGKFSVGAQFSLVRPAKNVFRTTRYCGGHWSFHALGNPYEDVGRVQVTRVTPEGQSPSRASPASPFIPAILRCPINPDPFPTTYPQRLDRFALPNGNIQGTLMAARTT